MKPTGTERQKQIGGYLYYEKCELGKGATGNVYRGKNKIDQTNIAVKVINENKICSDVIAYLLKNEINAVQRVSDPNVLKTFDVLRENGYCYIIMELYSGGNLRQFIKRKGKLSQIQSLQIFEGILSGYSSIKKAKILHRDLKCENILLTEQKKPIIIDFGFCEFMDSQNRPKTQYNVGSPGYMPPQAFNKNLYSEKSDVWALGVILHEMVTGNILQMHTRNVDKYFRDLESMKYPNIKLNYENQIIMHLLLKCLTVNKFERASIEDLRNMISIWKTQNIKIEVMRQSPQRKKIKSVVHNSPPFEKRKIEVAVQKKDQSVYATQNIESPIRKCAPRREKQFGKLKRKIMNKEESNSFSIQPIEILPVLPIQTKQTINLNRTMNSPVYHESISVKMSPQKNPQSLCSPTMSPGIPKFCRKTSTSSTNNLKIKLRMI